MSDTPNQPNNSAEGSQLDVAPFIRAQGLNTTFQISTPEDPAVQEARLKKEADDAQFERRMKVGIAIVLLGVLAFAGWIIVDPAYPTAQKDWAQSIFLAIVSGFVGYFAGVKTSK